MKSDLDYLLDTLAEEAESVAHEWLCGDVCRCDDVGLEFKQSARITLGDYDIEERGFVPVRRAIEEE